MNESASYAVDIPGYRILRKLGYGGMATVYLAEEARLGRSVALKIMSEDLSQGSNFAERFLAEGRMAAGLHHPNIVTIYNMGVAGDHYFISMEYIEGEPLSARIRSGVTPEFAVHTAKRIAVALGSAHARGILHRDIKPSNILFRENRFAVLADFGIAKALESDSELTLAGSVLGTPSYMSPQQASGQKIDHRSDLYSLGVVLFEMLASKRPFVGDTPVATALKHATDPIPRLPQPTAHFQPIIDRILAKSPADRFQDAEEFIQSLDAIEVNDASPGRDRTTIVLDQDVVQSLWEASTDSSSGTEASTGGSTGGSLPSIRLNQLTNAFTLVKPKLAIVAGLILLALAIGKFIDWKTERDFQRRMAINELSIKAEEHVAESRLIEPEGNNAVTAYRKILELDSDNELAIKGLAAIEEKFEQEVTDARVSKGPKQALSSAENVLHVFPDSPDLKQLRASIEQEVAAKELQSRIATLMEKANQQESELRLTEPEGDNAYATFRGILRLDPENGEARQGLNRIVARYQAWARNSEQAGDLTKALDMAEKGLQIAPENTELLALRSNVQQVLGLEKRIAESLDQAEQRIAQGKLLEPEEDNAYAAVAKVLDWEPENAKALELRSTIEASFVNKVMEAFEQGELRRGLAMAEQGSKLFRDQKDLEQLAENIRRELALEEMLGSAEEHFDAGRLIEPPGENALELYQKIVQQYPDNKGAAQGLQRIGEQFEALARDKVEDGALDEALTLVREGLKAIPQDAELIAMEKDIDYALRQQARISALLDQVRRQISQGQFVKPKNDNAYSTVQEIERLDPGNSQTKALVEEIAAGLTGKLRTMRDRGELGPSLALADQAQKLFADNQQLAQLAEEMRGKLTIDELLRSGNKSLSESPFSASSGKRAYDAYSKVLELDPDNQAARQGLKKTSEQFATLAVDQKNAGKQQQALETMKFGLQADPANPKLRDLQEELKQLLALNQIIERLAAQAKAQRQAGRLIEPEGDNAMQSLKEILELEPDNTDALAELREIAAVFVDRAQTFAEGGDQARAEEAITQGLRVDPEQDELHALRSKLAREEQQRQRIVEQQDTQQAAHIQTLVNRAQEALAGNRLTSPKQDNAVVHVRELLAYDPQHSEAQRILAAVITRYIGIADRSLDKGNVQGAQRAEEKAKGLVAEFNLAEGDIRRLEKRIDTEQRKLAEAEKKRKQAQRLAKAAEKEKNAVLGKEIDSLLDKARTALQSNRLTKPAGNNGVEYAAQVLRMKPGHAGAKGILQDVVGRYVALGEVALNSDQIDQAQDYQKAAQSLVESYRLVDTELQQLTARLVAELEKAQESAESTTSATPIAGDGAQEREDEMKRLREELEALRSKPEQAPKKKRKKVFLPPAF